MSFRAGAFVAMFALLAIVEPASSTNLGENVALDAQFEEARTVLANQPGSMAAGQLFQQLLVQDESYAPAYVELARILVQYNNSFLGEAGVKVLDEPSRDQVLGLIDRAIQLEPGYAESYVLYGFLAAGLGRSHLGLEMLDHAERLGSSNVWIQVNRAQIYEHLGNKNRAAKEYRQVVESAPNHAATNGAMRGLLRLSTDFDEMDSLHRQIISSPNSDVCDLAAYASFNLVHGRFDKAVELARSAVLQRNSCEARQILSLAIVSKAANQLLRHGDDQAFDSVHRQIVELGFTYEDLIFSAAVYPHLSDTVLALLRNGVDPNLKDQNGEGLLHHLIRHGVDDAIGPILDSGTDVNQTDSLGNTPLHFAASAGKSQVVQILLDAGGNPLLRNANNELPADLASRHDHEAVLALLPAANEGSAKKPWEDIVEDLDIGGADAISRAVHYASLNGKDHPVVVAALQTKLIAKPLEVLQHAEQAGATQLICSHSASTDPAVAAGFVAGALEKLQSTIETEFSGARAPGVLRSCRSFLTRVRGMPSPYRDLGTYSEQELRKFRNRAKEILAAVQGPNANLRKAEELLKPVLFANPEDIGALLMMARIRIEQSRQTSGQLSGRFDPELLRHTSDPIETILAKDNSVSEAWAYYGFVLNSDGLSGIAAFALQRALRSPDASIWAHHHFAEVLASTGRFDEALVEADRARSMAGTPFERTRIGVGYANILRQKGESAAAMHVFVDLANEYPSDRDTQRGLAEVALYDLNDLDTALTATRQLNSIGLFGEDNQLLAQVSFAIGAKELTENGPTEHAIDMFNRGKRQAYSLEDAFSRAIEHSATYSAAEAMYTAGIAVDAADNDGNTPLILAVATRQNDVIDKLISYGADVNRTNNWGQSALLVALMTANEDAGLALLAAGADPLRLDASQMTPQQMAHNQGMTALFKKLTEVSERSYPDWATFVSGVSKAYPEMISRAFELRSNSEVQAAIQVALAHWPQTVTRLAGEYGSMGAACGIVRPGDAEIPKELLQQSLASVTKTKHIRDTLQLVQANDYLVRCEALLEKAVSL
jgi:ankyrin repeat protein/predicted Zn-dependent protease